MEALVDLGTMEDGAPSPTPPTGTITDLSDQPAESLQFDVE